jgi:VanZ family protein
MHRSALGLLALVYAALVAYASLYPLARWQPSEFSVLDLMFAPWPRYWTWGDVLVNVLGYVPLGLLVGWATWRGRGGAGAVWLGWLAVLGWSLLLEWLQAHLPPRVPSMADWWMNAAGATLGVLGGTWLHHWPWMQRAERWQGRWFHRQDQAMLAWMALWPVALLGPSDWPFVLGHLPETIRQWVPPWGLGWGDLPLRLGTLAGLELGLMTAALLLPLLMAGLLWRPKPSWALPALPVLLLACVVTSAAAVLALGWPRWASWWQPNVGMAMVVAWALAVWLQAAPARWRARLALGLAGLLLLAGVWWQAGPGTGWWGETASLAKGRVFGVFPWLSWVWVVGAAWLLARQAARSPTYNSRP